MNQLQLFSKTDTLVSIDPTKNRYRVYQLEFHGLSQPHIVLRWGRLQHTRGRWGLRKKRWLGEKFIANDTSPSNLQRLYDGKIREKMRRGYVMWGEICF